MIGGTVGGVVTGGGDVVGVVGGVVVSVVGGVVVVGWVVAGVVGAVVVGCVVGAGVVVSSPPQAVTARTDIINSARKTYRCFFISPLFYRRVFLQPVLSRYNDIVGQAYNLIQ